MASITHVVLFQFKDGVSPDVVQTTCASLLALKENCLHPLTQRPYILSLKGGRDNSPEGLQGGLTHGFVAEFATVEDRAYYLEKDPAHLGFIADVQGLVVKAVVLDFADGVF
ncbi:hypothetical protein B0T19DRAFT_439645 [Cercophora scortea]|uniref:Stress-response A/B barrel domain-containing protein n=1 Tax=Cercophora scortea TaxID=314031 RepID=A0AAE0MIF7_9PEZI|nr:hypothetical protein B0T19DRAFT_439645 [Cercophora scortea]